MMKWAVSQVVLSKGTKLSNKNEVVDADVEETASRPKRLKKSENKDEVIDVVPEPIEKKADEAKEETEENK